MTQMVRTESYSDHRNSYVRYSDTSHTDVWQRDDGMPVTEDDVDELIYENYRVFPVDGDSVRVSYVDDYTVQIDYKTLYLD